MQPLFVADLDTLKAALRLSAIPAGSADVAAMLGDAVSQVRVRLYGRLGLALAAELVAIAPSSAPTTVEGLRRSLAESVEIRMVRVVLMRTLPTVFMDAGGGARKAWNEEALWRESPAKELERHIAALNASIEDDMGLLTGESEFGAHGTVHTYDGTPDVRPPVLGQSLERCPRTFS
jgi:hypothetical protein